jgi:hypothetical protein
LIETSLRIQPHGGATRIAASSVLAKRGLPNEPGPISEHLPCRRRQPLHPSQNSRYHGARSICLAALAIAAAGGQADARKPMHGLGAGVFEIALHLADDIWVVHAFQKKSTQGVGTPRREIDLIRDRLRRLKEMLR